MEMIKNMNAIISLAKKMKGTKKNEKKNNKLVLFKGNKNDLYVRMKKTELKKKK